MKKKPTEKSRKALAGDVFRINVTPAGTSFPWVRVHRFPYGIRGGSPQECHGVDATKAKGKRKTAIEIGESIIESSKVLREWFAG